MNLAKELRIGNIVLYEGVKDVIWRVEENNYVTDNYGHGATDEFLEPIPLTEEWLLKFGFEEIKEGLWSWIELIIPNKYDFKMYWDETEGMTIEDYPINCKHAHQLQNLYFALTGEELEITNDTKNS